MDRRDRARTRTCFRYCPASTSPATPAGRSSGFGIRRVQHHGKNTGNVPALDLPTGGFFEALFECSWGESLQSAPQVSEPAIAERRVFGSSAGQIDAAYTAELDPRTKTPAHTWNARLLLNGFIEVKSLVSWPSSVAAEIGSGALVTLPAARPTGTPPALSHVRHTARVLLNQHVAPANVLQPSLEPHIFLQIAPGQAWMTRAVIEHQLVVVELTAQGGPPGIASTDRDARVTLVQEVRFCAPSTFAAFLTELSNLNTTSPSFPLGVPGTTLQSPEILVESLPTATRGYLSTTMINRLSGTAGALASLTDKDCMIIDASVIALMRVNSVADAGLSNLAYLPSGTTRAVLASRADYQSPVDDARDDPLSWFLLALPFLGRTQPDTFDGLAASRAPAASASNLRVDPILQINSGRVAGTAPDRLALALASWEDQHPTQVAFAEYDLARHRRFTRLDPSSLRESWFRLSLLSDTASRRTGLRVGAREPSDRRAGHDGPARSAGARPRPGAQGAPPCSA